MGEKKSKNSEGKERNGIIGEASLLLGLFSGPIASVGLLHTHGESPEKAYCFLWQTRLVLSSRKMQLGPLNANDKKKNEEIVVTFFSLYL